MSSSRAAAAQRRLSQAARSRENKLRNAISLYHLSPAFFPAGGAPSSSTSTAESSEASSADLDAHLDHTIRADIFGPGSRVEDPCTSDNLPNFSSGLSLVSKLNKHARAGPQDGSSAIAAIGAQPNLSALSVSSPLKARLEFSNRITSAERPNEPRPQFPGSNEPAQRSIQPGSSGAVRSLKLDERSARIRDAFFGTVEGGERPGLEVLLERRGRSRTGEDL